MSKTYIGAILQFIVTLGLLSSSELQQLSDAIVALIAIVPLLITLYGRIKAKVPVNIFGVRKPE